MKPTLIWERYQGADPSIPRPVRSTEGAAGRDFYAPGSIYLQPGQVAILGSGWTVAIPNGYFGLITARSSWRAKGLTVEGVIDSDYRGQIFLSLANIGTSPIDIKATNRIAQMVVLPDETSDIEGCIEDETARGIGGLGSTGA